ncbi:unnamed protein product [Bursaphelenchus okinawaensis]|uniref:Dehydrogenase/reductase SDR family member 1 n=1 Tax=Bursaphelenchus okinawaensis TaxID=465554 RepID=A0A811L6I4_9BILA|nr:unnamed protein product [Bursaphelenchus okinawaensis]CAG9119079.1 unnamed protein product [Bursaphelenchus okinawaensis]
MSLKSQVALVTGASRGIGKGIAVSLGEAGATVYVTGRRPEIAEKLSNSSTLQQVADEINRKGGKGIAVYCDHSNPQDVKELFERIDKEQQGQLDILVNNAYSAVSFLMKRIGKKFYELEESPEEVWDTVNNVGLRNYYICSVYATRMMIKRKAGLIVNIGSMGGLKYMFSVSYGAGKDAKDRMAADIAHELQGTGITCVSVWPAAVKTEYMLENVVNGKNDALSKAFAAGEDLGYAGRGIAKLAADPNKDRFNGKILLTADLAETYDIRGEDGKIHRPSELEERKRIVEIINDIRTSGVKREYQVKTQFLGAI